MSTSGIDWKNHLIELLVVFIGITAAFGLNNWQEKRKIRELEHTYIESLTHEIDENIRQLDTLSVMLDSDLNAVTKLERLVSDGLFDQDSLMTYAMHMAELTRFHATQAVYETLKSSGDLGIISDFRLRSLLSKVNNANFELGQVEQVYENYINTYVLNFFFTNFDFSRGRVVDEAAFRKTYFRNLIKGYELVARQKITAYRKVAGIYKEIYLRLTESSR